MTYPTVEQVAAGMNYGTYRTMILAPVGYPHVRAYDDIAESVDEGLADLGIYHPDGLPIVVGGHLIPAAVPEDAIIYNLEPEPVLSDSALRMFRNHVVWDYSPRNAEKLRARDIDVTAVVHPGYAKGLSRVDRTVERDIDVLFYGSWDKRRGHVFDQIKALGLNLVTKFGVYGLERDKLISRAKLAINLHFAADAIFLETVRMQYLLANSVPVLSELSCDIEANELWNGGVWMAPYNRLAETASMLCAHEERLKGLGEGGRQWLEAHPASAALERAFATLQ